MASTDRTLRARIAAHERWAREPDRTAATAAARQANADRYLAAARALHPTLSHAEVLVRAENLRSADMTRLARARWGKGAKAADHAEGPEASLTTTKPPCGAAPTLTPLDGSTHWISFRHEELAGVIRWLEAALDALAYQNTVIARERLAAARAWLAARAGGAP